MRFTFRGAVAVILVLAAAAVCVRLGIWQLDRLEQRRARNAVLRSAQALPPLVLDSAALARVAAEPARYVNRRVRVEGAYDPSGEVVLRGRTHEGSPGVHLVTPLRVPGTAVAVLVNRGWVPSPDAATVDAGRFAEPGARVVEGVLREVPATGDGGAPVRPASGGPPTFRRLDLAALRAHLPYPVLPLYVEQLPTPGGPPLPRRVPPAALDEGPHLGYAIQWFSFAAIFLVGLLVMLALARRSTSNS